MPLIVRTRLIHVPARGPQFLQMGDVFAGEYASAVAHVQLTIKVPVVPAMHEALEETARRV